MIIFKHERQESQFKSGLLDSRLRIIIFSVSGYVFYEHHRIIRITEVFRPQTEQDNTYFNHPDPVIVESYKKEPWLSVHQLWRGIDFTIEPYITEQQNRDIENFLNKNFKYTTTRGYKTFKYHNVGTGGHFHTQTDKDRTTEIIKI